MDVNIYYAVSCGLRLLSKNFDDVLGMMYHIKKTVFSTGNTLLLEKHPYCAVRGLHFRFVNEAAIATIDNKLDLLSK